MEKTHSTAARFAVPIFAVSSLLVTIAFATPYWLENWSKYYGDKFDKLGLWVHCFRSLSDPNDETHTRYFTGCRWIYNPFTFGYAELRGFLMPPFFIAVQTFFTFCFTLMLVAMAGVLAYVLCFQHDMHNKIRLCRLIAWDLMAAGIFGTIAVIIFGALGDSRDWMPHFDHNYLSWSFGLAVVGTYGLIMTSVLFFVEAKVQNKKAGATQSQATFSMEHGKA